ncbi:MAG: D-Ala-D-Ala carboxypeptidase family metallohydrolase [Clostridia bacterium]|nr:D-Ala-D-Ala carboxypeptidase family metallohydrolase [Clostridia bacterium]
MITEHFTLEELTKTNQPFDNAPNIEQITNLKALANTVLEPLRVKFGQPIIVNSGFRSKEVNDAVKGSKTSQHLSGSAADITSKDNKALWDIAKQMIEDGDITVGQLIWEKGNKIMPDWIHVSTPTNKHNNEIKYIK